MPITVFLLLLLFILKAEGKYILCLSFFFLITVACFVPIGIRNSQKYSMDSFGLHIYSLFGKDKLIPWDSINDVCLCCLFDIDDRLPVFRFNTDTDGIMENASKEIEKNRIPKWLKKTYNDRHHIYYFEYQPEAIPQVQKFYPNYHQHESFTIWSMSKTARKQETRRNKKRERLQEKQLKPDSKRFYVYKNELKLIRTVILRETGVIVTCSIVLGLVCSGSPTNTINRIAIKILFYGTVLLLFLSIIVTVALLFSRRAYWIYCIKTEDEVISYNYKRKALCSVNLNKTVYYSVLQTPVDKVRFDSFVVISNAPFICENHADQNHNVLFAQKYDPSKIIILPKELCHLVKSGWIEVTG